MAFPLAAKKLKSISSPSISYLLHNDTQYGRSLMSKIPAALATGLEEMETDNPNPEKVETDNKIPTALATGLEEMETDNPNLEKVETDNGDNMLDVLEYEYTEEMEAYM
ncbi:hypothetical protein OROHE_003181 [Orobanche hederae]